MGTDADQPWFADGLRFECTQCGNCCTGEPGYVWVNEEETLALAKLTGKSIDEFEKTYVRRVGRRKTLREKANGDCVFYDRAKGCTVYEHRPRQCRTWPFWESNLRSPETWKRTCTTCPGSGQGQLVSVEQIIEQAKLIKV